MFEEVGAHSGLINEMISNHLREIPGSRRMINVVELGEGELVLVQPHREAVEGEGVRFKSRDNSLLALS